MTDHTDDPGRAKIDFDPAKPKPSDFSTATEMAAAAAQGGLPAPVPWPAGLAPVPAPPATPPETSDPLPACDVVIVTWTAAESRTLSTLLTPGVPIEQWFDYRSNVDAFIPKVTGTRAPFNDPDPPRYYHSLGLYYPITLAGQRVLCMKSGLHPAYDGPDLPVVDLWKQIIAETGASLIITTGTGGGIGADMLLGDVAVAAQTLFDCKQQFAAAPFNHASYDASPLPADPTARLTPAMLAPNAAKVAQSKLPSHPDGLPAILYPGCGAMPDPKIVTTDFFAYDTTDNQFGLQGLANVCEMGDATLGLAISQLDNPPKWAAIRNASDPQIGPPLDQASKTAGDIYSHYGGYTTAASVLACWSLICQLAPAPPTPATPQAEAMAAPPAVPPGHALAAAQQRALQLDPAHLILQLAASTGLEIRDLSWDEVPGDSAGALSTCLDAAMIDPLQVTIGYRLIRFEDETFRPQQWLLAQVVGDTPVAFRGAYLFAGAELIVKQEFA